MSTKQILKQCQVFATLSEPELEQVAKLAVEREYEAGTIIFQGKDSTDELLVVVDGKIALQMMMPTESGQMGRKITVDVVTKEEVVGWSVVVEPYIYTFTAVCLQNTKVLAINGAKLRTLLRENCSLGYKVLKELIKVVALRLDDTRRVLVSERVLTGLK